jgi:hypothetical protein
MKPIRTLAPVILALMLGANPLAAQRAADAEGAAPGQDTADSAAPQPGTSKPAPSAPSSAPAERPVPNRTHDSPFDYRSSEEISEDLSVSFPVDI